MHQVRSQVAKIMKELTWYEVAKGIGEMAVFWIIVGPWLWWLASWLALHT